MRPDLLGTEPFQRCPQGISDGQTEQATADSVEAGQLGHRG